MKRTAICIILLIMALNYVKAQNIVQEGVASYYADKFEGRTTASGEKYKHSKYTAAHKTLPFGTIVRVTNIKNSKSVQLKINDRGPYVDGRIIDVSKAAAQDLDMINQGLAEVRVEVIDAGDGKGNDYNTGAPGQLEMPVEQREFYEFNVKRSNPTGFGVQIGSYQELANLVRLANNLKSSYKKQVIVQVSLINDLKIYKIILGNEKTRAKAEQLKNKLQKRYPDSFIVSFGDI